MKQNYRKLEINDSAKKIFSHIAYFGAGFLMANGTVFGSYSPFGISMAAAVPFPGVIFSFFGSIAGYIFFPKSGSSFRYIAAMIAVLSIRWTLNDLKKLNSHSLYSSTVCFFPIIATGLAMMSVSGFSAKTAAHPPPPYMDSHFHHAIQYNLCSVCALNASYWHAKRSEEKQKGKPPLTSTKA